MKNLARIFVSKINEFFFFLIFNLFGWRKSTKCLRQRFLFSNTASLSWPVNRYVRIRNKIRIWLLRVHKCHRSASRLYSVACVQTENNYLQSNRVPGIKWIEIKMSSFQKRKTTPLLRGAKQSLHNGQPLVSTGNSALDHILGIIQTASNSFART